MTAAKLYDGSSSLASAVVPTTTRTGGALIQFPKQKGSVSESEAFESTSNGIRYARHYSQQVALNSGESAGIPVPVVVGSALFLLLTSAIALPSLLEWHSSHLINKLQQTRMEVAAERAENERIRECVGR